jgi:hypothetical protein
MALVAKRQTSMVATKQEMAMPVEQYKGKGPEERIRDRYRPSNDFSTSYHHTQVGEGERRVYHSIHHPTKQHGVGKGNEKAQRGGDQL